MAEKEKGGNGGRERGGRAERERERERETDGGSSSAAAVSPVLQHESGYVHGEEFSSCRSHLFLCRERSAQSAKADKLARSLEEARASHKSELEALVKGFDDDKKQLKALLQRAQETQVPLLRAAIQIKGG